MVDLTNTPNDLPVPVDDGGAAHLAGMTLPNIHLAATNSETIQLDKIEGLVVLYIYPMTGRPDIPLPAGWDEIPGARGCTPQSCAFRDHFDELQEYNASVYGLSTQDSLYQQEAKGRLHLPFELLSDSTVELKTRLNIPTFEVNGKELYKRITLIVRQSVIVKHFYPVFPPGENATEVISWLRENN